MEVLLTEGFVTRTLYENEKNLILIITSKI